MSGLNQDLLTGVEAAEWLASGNLPDNFRERVAIFVEFYRCPNCDGVRDMECVSRTWGDVPSWCGYCCDDDGNVVAGWER